MWNGIAQGYQFSYEAIRLLNISETTRSLLDLTTFAMGFVGLHNVFYSSNLEDRDISKLCDHSSGWKQTAFKTADFLGSLALIASCMRSGPATAVWKWGIHHILSTEKLERLFGQQGSLPSEKMDRTIATVAFLLGLPSTLKTLYMIYHWVTTPRLELKQVEEESERTDGLEEREKREERETSSSCLAIYVQDSYLTFKTVSETANRLLRTPHK